MNHHRTLKTQLKRSLPLLAALCLAPLVAAAAPVPAPDKLLPEDTLVVLTAPDFVKLRELYRQSPQTQLWNDPAMKAFKEKFMNKLQEEVITPLERELNIHFSDYTNLVQGQFTFALTQNGWQGKDQQRPGIVVLADAKENSDKLKKNLADLKKKWVDAGKTIKTEKIRDVEFSVLVISDKDMPKALKKLLGPEPRFADPSGEGKESTPADDGERKKPESKNNLYIGQSDSLLIMGTAPKPIEKILIRLSGGTSPTLGEQATFEAKRSIFRDVPAYGWVNVKSFVDVLLQGADDKDAAAEENPFAFNPKKIVSAMGLPGLKSVAMSVQQTSEGGLFQVFLNVPESSRTGVFKILAGEPKETAAPPFVPADALKFQRWRIDGQKTWATLESMLKQISPSIGGTLDFLLSQAAAAAKEKDPDFDLKKSLIGSLGDDIVSFEKKPSTASWAEFSSPPSLTLIGSPKPEQLASALKMLTALAPQSAGTGPTEREFLGRKIYSIEFGGGRGTPGARRRTLNFVATSSYVALSSDAATLEEFLRSSDKPGKPLRETPGLAEATPKVAGAGTSWFTYENQAEGMHALLDLLKKDSSGATNAAVLPTLPGGLADLKDWFDVSLLPSYDKVSKYFYFTVSALSASVDGLTFKVFAPTPPQMKK